MRLLATPVFAVIARTKKGRSGLSPENLHPWVKNWLGAPDAAAWWFNHQDGVAIFKPDYYQELPGSETTSCLSIRGSIIADKLQPLLAAASFTNSFEAILNLLLNYGAAAIRQMRGQFALCYWDAKRRALILARDHLGQRCLFVRTEPDHLIICSELAPLLHSPFDANTLHAESAFWYLAFGMPPPGETLVKNIRRVPAAHCWQWEPDAAITEYRYWSPLHTEAPEEVTEDFIQQGRTLLELSLYRRLPDTGYGMFLSGGVDSTFLAVTARQMGISLPSFTAAFDEAYGINESDYAREVCNWLSNPHYEVPIHTGQVMEQLDDVFLSAAEPCAAWAIITHFQMLVKAQQLGINCMISGLGADEIFGGYDHFRGYYARYLRYVNRVTVSGGTLDTFDTLLNAESQAERRILYPGVARFFDDKALREGLEAPYNNWQYTGHLRAFYRECRKIKPEADVMEMMIAHECQHRIPDLLFVNFEPFARRLGIEMAYPFLDPDVVALAGGLSVTSRYRTKKGTFSLKLKELMPHFKYAMMRIAEDRVPKEIIHRPRKSLTAPFGQWLFQPEFSGLVLSKIQNSRFWKCGMVRPQYLQNIISRVAPGPNPAVFQLWSLLTLSSWYDRYIDHG